MKSTYSVLCNINEGGEGARTGTFLATLRGMARGGHTRKKIVDRMWSGENYASEGSDRKCPRTKVQ